MRVCDAICSKLFAYHTSIFWSERMRILLLGVGMQGKAALDDLVRSDHVSEVVAADQDRVVAGPVRIGIRGLPLPEAMLKTGPHVAERFDLCRPHDAEGFPLTVKALHAAPDLGPAFIKELAGFCGHGRLRLKEVSMCTH